MFKMFFKKFRPAAGKHAPCFALGSALSQDWEGALDQLRMPLQQLTIHC